MAKKILYIGPYREFSGAGVAARNYIQALFEAGHDVCIAPIYYIGDVYPEQEISSDILSLENNYLFKYDIVIQHCHPFDYVYSSQFEKNIGIYQFNSGNVNPALVSRLDLMDEIIVNSEFNKRALNQICRTSVSDKIKVVPELIDINLVDQKYIEYPWKKNQKNSVVFYTIGDFIERKNLNKIIKAFVYTFNDYDNAELVIKTKPHHSHHELDIINKELEYSIDKIYRSLRIDKKSTKQPKIMVGPFEYQYLLALHKNANIYVDASMAENFGYSVLEAALFGNYLIVNENSSAFEISENAFATPSRAVQTEDSYTANVIENTIDNYWYDIHFEELCENMQKAYNIALCNNKTNHDINRFTYKEINAII